MATSTSPQHINTDDIAPGATVRVDWGFGKSRLILIEKTFSNVKNGRPGFDGWLVHPKSGEILGDSDLPNAWAYNAQVLEVL